MTSHARIDIREPARPGVRQHVGPVSGGLKHNQPLTGPAVIGSTKMACNQQFKLIEELNLSEAAAVLGIDRRTVRKLIELGVLAARIASPPTSKRPRYRIPAEEVISLRNSYHRQACHRSPRKQITRRRSKGNFTHIQLKVD